MSKVTHEYLDKLIEEHSKLVQPREEDLEMYKLAKKGLVTSDEWFKLTKVFQMQAVIANQELLHNDLVGLYEVNKNKSIKKVLAHICNFLKEDLESKLKQMEQFVASSGLKGTSEQAESSQNSQEPV